jgi:hypothetical protein
MRRAFTSVCAAIVLLVVGAPACAGILGDDYILLEPKDLGPCNSNTPSDCPAGETCDFDVCVKPCPENACATAAWCDVGRHVCSVPMGTPCPAAGPTGCGSGLHCIDRDRGDLPTAPYCTTYPLNIPGGTCPDGFTRSGGDTDDCKKP